MKAIARSLYFFALVLCTNFTSAQIFPQQSGGGPNPATNILSGIPNSGVLRIDYNFYTIPDSLDVYYNNTDIFSSGYLQYSGEFNIPYGSGDSTSLSLMIVINQGGAIGGNANTAWDYIPSIVAPEPSSFVLTSAGLGTAAILTRRSKRQCPAK